jgi:hypothetical protein
MSPGWLDSGRPQLYPDFVLSFKADQKHLVRLLDDKPPIQVWRHTCRDEMGRYVYASCVGRRNGCPFCEANKHPKFPVGSQYVKTVFVVDEGVYKLLVGNEVWKGIEAIYNENNSVTTVDLSITRTDRDRKGTYSVVHKPQKTEIALPSDPDMPKPDNYVAWLKANIKLVDKIVIEEVPAGSEDGESTTTSTDKPTDTGQPKSERRKELDEELNKLLKKFNATTFAQVLEKITPGNSDVDKLDDEQLERFITDYKVASGTDGKN